MNYEEFEIEDPFFFLDDIEVDQNLFAQIQEYVQEVQANPDCEEFLWVSFGCSDFSIHNAKTFDPDKILPIKNNKLPDNEKTGVILCGGINNFTPEGWEIFKLSELFSLCEITSDPKIEDTTCLSFPFNATPLCKTIQYLAKLFNCPLDKIEITIEDPNATTNVNTSNSDSNGCFGMLVLMISIGGAGIYGLIELASKLIV